MSASERCGRSPVTVSLDELRGGTLSFAALEEAFGPSSLGIIVVKDLPAEFAELRRTLLSYSSYLANLPAEELAKLECPGAKWLVGWSCGKETLKDGRYDTLKGSYYVNCASAFEDPSQRAKLAKAHPDFPEYTDANVWPAEDVLPGFEKAFRALCNLIVDTAALVARACDRYAEVHVGIDDPGGQYKKGYLEHVVRTSLTTKARLLHYFPSQAHADISTNVPPTVSKVDGAKGEGEEEHNANDQNDEQDDWCATHLDHGCLTGLTSAMFIDEAEAEAEAAPTPADNSNFSAATMSKPASTLSLPPLPELPAPPDPTAGLHIHARDGSITKVSIPRDCLAFQTGEALEVITRGKFRAVPHFVRGVQAASLAQGQRIARNTLAVFTQPNLWEMVDERRDFAAFAREIVEKNH